MVNTPVLIAALTLLGLAALGTGLYFYFTRARRAKRKAERARKTTQEAAAIKQVAKRYLQSQNDHATQLTSTKLAAMPGRHPRGVSAFYLYFSYHDLTQNEAREDVIEVTIKRTRRRGERRVEEITRTAPVTGDKAALITKIKQL